MQARSSGRQIGCLAPVIPDTITYRWHPRPNPHSDRFTSATFAEQINLSICWGMNTLFVFRLSKRVHIGHSY